jgi:hypothetical protein
MGISVDISHVVGIILVKFKDKLFIAVSIV